MIAAGDEALASLSDFLSPTPHRIETIDGGPRAARRPGGAGVRAEPGSSAALRLVHVEAMPPSEVAGGERLTALEGIAAARAPRCRRRGGDAGGCSPMRTRRRSRTMLARADTCALLLRAQEHFGTTGRFVVIAGWIPDGDAPRLQAAVAAAAPRAVVDVEHPASGVEARADVASVPILHHNPLLLRPFQPLIELYDTPSYGELQPTAFFGISFLLMFGLMFGDLGQGGVLALAGYYLFRYVPRYLDYGILLMEAGAASACFGLLYGSFFGIAGALPVLWLEPAHDLPAFMRIAVVFGVVLVSAGLLLNVVNSWRLGQRAAALFSVRGLFGAFLYWTAVALAGPAVDPVDLRGAAVAPVDAAGGAGRADPGARAPGEAPRARHAGASGGAVARRCGCARSKAAWNWSTRSLPTSPTPCPSSASPRSPPCTRACSSRCSP